MMIKILRCCFNGLVETPPSGTTNKKVTLLVFVLKNCLYYDIAMQSLLNFNNGCKACFCYPPGQSQQLLLGAAIAMNDSAAPTGFDSVMSIPGNSTF
jgi:hypothetical protein